MRWRSPSEFDDAEAAKDPCPAEVWGFLGGHTSFCRWLEPGEATVVSADPSGVLDDSEVKPPFFPPSDPKSRAPAGAGRGGGGCLGRFASI